MLLGGTGLAEVQLGSGNFISRIGAFVAWRALGWTIALSGASRDFLFMR